MAAIDFITALGRLLQDGALRDAFSKDRHALAERMNVADTDRTLFLQLVPADLEFQARVLLRKRFDLVRQRLPGTCQELDRGGANASWEEFQSYGRTQMPTAKDPGAEDILGFCRHLQTSHPQALCPEEFNRVHFAYSHRPGALHLVKRMLVRGRRHGGLQIFLRYPSGRWHEWRLGFGL